MPDESRERRESGRTSAPGEPPTSLTERRNGASDRRSGHDRRRTYNRRHDDEVSPPYFDAFDRIATALEHIEELMRVRSVVLPDAGGRHPAQQ
jgi:hypothetical protein